MYKIEPSVFDVVNHSTTDNCSLSLSSTLYPHLIATFMRGRVGVSILVRLKR